MQPALRWLCPGTASTAAMLLTGAPKWYSGHLPVTQQHMGISLRTFTRISRALFAGSLEQSLLLTSRYHRFCQTSPEPGALDQQLHRERWGQSLDSDMMNRQRGSHAQRVSERQSQNESKTQQAKRPWQCRQGKQHRISPQRMRCVSREPSADPTGLSYSIQTDQGEDISRNFFESIMRLDRLVNVTARGPEVLAALTLLAKKAAGLHDGCTAFRLNVLAWYIRRHQALEANFTPNSELYEHVRRLMLEAAADSSTYTDARTCQRVAKSQELLQLPCEEFWCNLSSKGVPCLGGSPQQSSDLKGKPEHLPKGWQWVIFSCGLLRLRNELTVRGLMPPPSSDLYTELLRAISRAFDRHQKVDSHTRKIALSALGAMGDPSGPGPHIAATQGSPIKDLQAKVALKLLNLLEDDVILATHKMKVNIIWRAISVFDLAAQLDPKALGKFEDALVCQAPRMSSRQLANTACTFSAAGMLSLSKGSAALLSAVAHALPKMTTGDLVRVCTSFVAAKKEPQAEALVPFLEALPSVAAKLGPKGVGNILYMIGVLSRSCNISQDQQHIINPILTAAQRTAPRMSPMELCNSALAFQMISLPFDRPAGHALLAELPRVIKKFNGKMLEKVMCALVSANVAFSKELTDALWTALIRLAPSFSWSTHLAVLGHTSLLKKRVDIPEGVYTVLLQEVLRRAPLLSPKQAGPMVKELTRLGLKIPDELFARL